MVAGSLVPLNSTMIAVGLPDMARDLGVGQATGAIVVTAYLVAMLVCQPLAGRLGDRLGTARVATAALIGFGLASLAAGAAPTFPVLLGCRCLQAVFGSALIPNAQAVLRAVIADEHRGRAFGIFAAGVSSGAALGPLLGGVLVDVSGWRAIFLVNVPVAVPAVVLFAGLRASADPAGTALAGSWRALRTRAFLAACATQSTSNLSLYTVVIVLPIVLSARGWSPSATGLALSGLTIGTVVLAPVGGRLGDRWGRRSPIMLGMTTVTAGCVVLAVGVGTPALMIAGALMIGAGLGIANASLQAAAVESVPLRVAGSAAGVFSTSRYAGSIIGSLAVAATSVSAAPSARPVLVVACLTAGAAVVTASRVGGRGATLAS